MKFQTPPFRLPPSPEPENVDQSYRSKLKTLKSTLPVLGSRLQQLGRIGATDRDRGRGRQAARLRVWLRDGPNCKGCGKLIDITPGTPDPFELDHTIPLWAGGKDEDANRQCLCPECHKAKTAIEAADRARGG